MLRRTTSISRLTATMEGGTDAAALARKGHANRVATTTALRDEKSALEVTASDESLELVTDELRHRAGVLLEVRDESGPMLADDRHGVAARGVARDV